MPEDPSRDTSATRPALLEGAHPSLEQVLDLLACPACLAPLRLKPLDMVCTACGRAYPVLDGIPILLVDRARLPA